MGTSNDTRSESHNTKIDRINVKEIQIPPERVMNPKQAEELSRSLSQYDGDVDSVKFKMRVFDKNYNFEMDQMMEEGPDFSGMAAPG